MTGIQIGNNTLLRIIFSIAYACFLVFFAIFDIKNKRVPNKALAYFIPIVLLSVPIGIVSGEERLIIYLLDRLCAVIIIGASVTGISLMTHDSIGGGDIKLIALLCIVHGLSDMTAILLVALFLAMIIGILIRTIKRQKAIHLAFVPYLALGCIASLILKF